MKEQIMAKRQNINSLERRPLREAPVPIDEIDKKILSALRADGRLTISQLAQKVSLSPSPCWVRVKRLEASGAISAYIAVLNPRAIGVPIMVFVEITLDKHHERVLEAFGEALAELPEVIDAYLVTGEYDYLVKVAVASTEHFERFLRESLYRIEGIRHSRSTFALRALKEGSSVDPLLLKLL
jgi:Lrp/AsnC family transcriptional regulator, leucine-responsive regulatory protein